MPWRIICSFVALFVLANAQDSGRSHRWDSREPWKNLSDNLIDIDVETERNTVADPTWQDMEEMSGSGSGMDMTDDEDLLGSGSGSGDGMPEIGFTHQTRPVTVKTTTTTSTTTTTPVPTTSKRRSPCQQLRDASQHLSSNYVPTCDSKGDYHILQCRGHMEKGNCWCADLRGREIPGTDLQHDIPDCERGTNLNRCVFQLVWQMRKTVMSSFRPQCTQDGDFESTQCKGHICYCVDQKTGDKVAGTEVFQPDRPVCNGTTPLREVGKDERTETEITLFPPGKPTTPSVDEEVKTRIVINLGGGLDDKEEEEEESEDDNDTSLEVSNETGDGHEPVKQPSSAAMMTQPGILAAIIGGSVVLLLCAILLAMFIIYRMKKKDEGSYPLDEPKKMPNYSYQRAPEKEFYA
ncbi:uncharacterized protein LOC143291119 [Babylonia areolata]|uniref:uncharacterized protein LOC143291119 n=1 Tax=Babylonia areolata TaxID=304850 RepID=UPI003FD0E2EF